MTPSVTNNENRLAPESIRESLRQIMATQKVGSHEAALKALESLASTGALETMAWVLPVIFQLQGKPFTLNDYAQFGALYNATIPKTVLFKTARQVAKSTNLAARSVLLSVGIPFLKTLCVTPRFEQIRRFSANYVRPFIEHSPLRHYWTSSSTESSVLQRSFTNNASIVFSFAMLDADRVRGVPADQVAIDEVQDMDPAHLPVINSTMSASPWELSMLAGTPKTRDNTIEELWYKSSQAEWFVKCRHCGFYNIPSTEYHLLKMIGPMHENIGREYPGLICTKCAQCIDPRPPFGRWVHKKPHLRNLLPGYHIPQPVLPLHCCYPEKWAMLLRKQNGWDNFTTAKFHNEILGESMDVGARLVTLSELESAACLPWKNNPRIPNPAMMQRLRHYTRRVLAVDWGGGGESETSFTVIVLMGVLPGGKIDVLWAKQLMISNDHISEGREIIRLYSLFNADLLVHDYTGAGTVRETTMAQLGFPIERMMPISYVRAASHNLMRYVPPTPLHNRGHYNVDKSRSLLYTCQAIKLKLIKFFQMDDDQEQPGLIRNFLSLVEDMAPTGYGSDIYRIVKAAKTTDDFAQAVNIGAAALWHMTTSWPNFAQAAAKATISEATMREVNGEQ